MDCLTFTLGRFDTRQTTSVSYGYAARGFQRQTDEACHDRARDVVF